jgi:DNA-binding transcriptional ArsR family regulator
MATLEVKKAAKAQTAQWIKKTQRAAILLKHGSDATRLQIILALVDGERHVGALCEELGQTQPSVSHHLALLRHGGIVNVRRQGKNNFYSLSEKGESLAGILKEVLP